MRREPDWCGTRPQQLPIERRVEQGLRMMHRLHDQITVGRACARDPIGDVAGPEDLSRYIRGRQLRIQHKPPQPVPALADDRLLDRPTLMDVEDIFRLHHRVPANPARDR